jgi:hypothetical protein
MLRTVPKSASNDDAEAALLNDKEDDTLLVTQNTIEETPNHLQRIKLFVLITLLIQNSGQALITNYSQGILKEKYSLPEVILVTEMIKLSISCYLTLQTKEEHGSPLIGSGVNKLIWLLMNSSGVLLVVVLYSFQNVLSFYAQSKVEASLYSVLTQLKVSRILRILPS